MNTSQSSESQPSELQQSFQQLKGYMAQRLLGQTPLIDAMLLALLCDGHLLIEGYPGTAKTRAVRVLSQCLNATMGRVQFTPDLLPADVTGAEVYHHLDGSGQLSFEPGPIFNHLVLADEINRAPAKVQSALLEAMAEKQVTVAGETYPLPAMFMVLATQNPIEQQGTYALPEAQMDRFLLKVSLGFPNQDDELAIIRLVRGEEQLDDNGSGNESRQLKRLVNQDSVLAARKAISQVHVSEAIESYIVRLVMATRAPEALADPAIQSWISLGVSPRASIALDRCARGHAWLNGRDHVVPEDVQRVYGNVIAHRIGLSYQAQAEGLSATEVAQAIMRQIAVA